MLWKSGLKEEILDSQKRDESLGATHGRRGDVYIAMKGVWGLLIMFFPHGFEICLFPSPPQKLA